jgi:phi13 family phage major tail protein
MNWYSNDIVEETFKNVVDIDVEIVLGKLSNEVKSLIMGSTYTEDGVMIEASNDAQQEFAVIVVLSQMGTVNGTLNYVFYRTKLTLEGGEAETKTDSITDSQLTLSGKAIPLANGRIASSIDSLDAKADAQVIANWTKSVYMPE